MMLFVLSIPFLPLPIIKAGHGTINGKNRNGWFIGLAESREETYIFSTNSNRYSLSLFPYCTGM